MCSHSPYLNLLYIYIYFCLRISCVFLSKFDWAAPAALDDFCHVPLYFGGPKKEKLIYNLLVASVCTSCTILRERETGRENERERETERNTNKQRIYFVGKIRQSCYQCSNCKLNELQKNPQKKRIVQMMY